jgi:hypothetical protein
MHYIREIRVLVSIRIVMPFSLALDPWTLILWVTSGFRDGIEPSAIARYRGPITASHRDGPATNKTCLNSDGHLVFGIYCTAS